MAPTRILLPDEARDNRHSDSHYGRLACKETP